MARSSMEGGSLPNRLAGKRSCRDAAIDFSGWWWSVVARCCKAKRASRDRPAKAKLGQCLDRRRDQQELTTAHGKGDVMGRACCRTVVVAGVEPLPRDPG